MFRQHGILDVRLLLPFNNCKMAYLVELGVSSIHKAGSEGGRDVPRWTFQARPLSLPDNPDRAQGHTAV